MEAEEFFYENAGYSYDPKKETPEAGRRACAQELAEAERWFASQDDLEYQVSPDFDGDTSWMSEEERKQEHECIAITLVRRKTQRTEHYPYTYWSEEYLASLCGIWDADENYIRVVEAELALEAMGRVGL
jgi:hypothetical protein